jgi:protein-S-isoprenylcysteine O-methyltransferase Ste14
MSTLERKVPPLALTAFALFAVLASGLLFPDLSLAFPGQAIVTAFLGSSGAALLIGAALQFRCSRTTLSPISPERASTFVATGAYRISRNPMYLGMALLIAAVAIWFGSLPGVMIVVGFCAYITRFQIKPEERAMLKLFGAQYTAYMADVRRWV